MVSTRPGILECSLKNPLSKMFGFGKVASLILILSVADITSAAYTFSLENDLRTLLFTTNSYNVLIRPSETVDVSVTFTLITVDSLNIRDQALKLSGYLTLEWTDSRLNWTDQSTYVSDIPMIYSTETYVWRPPIIIENSINDIAVISDDQIPMRITNSGGVTWTPSGIYTTHCESSVIYYPFDTQTCDFVVSTWGYTSREITLKFSSSIVDMSFYKKNGEWNYEEYWTSDISTTREGQSFSQLTYYFKFKRRPLYHVLNTLMPTILLAFLSCMVFKLAADSGEKIGYSLTVLLSYAVYLTLVADNIPTTSITPSLLSVYLVIILMMGMFSVLLTIIVLDCHFKEDDEEIPPWVIKWTDISIRILSFGSIKCICLRKNNTQITNFDKETDNEKRKEDEEKNTDEEQVTWKKIGKLLDMIFLRLYLIVISLMTFAFLMAFVIGYRTE